MQTLLVTYPWSQIPQAEEPGKGDGAPPEQLQKKDDSCGHCPRKRRNAHFPAPENSLARGLFSTTTICLQSVFSEASGGTWVRSFFMTGSPNNLQLQHGGKVSSRSPAAWSKSWSSLWGRGWAAKHSGFCFSPPSCHRPSEGNVQRVSSQRTTQNSKTSYESVVERKYFTIWVGFLHEKHQSASHPSQKKF